MYLFELKLTFIEDCYINDKLYCSGDIEYFHDFLYADSLSSAYEKLSFIIHVCFDDSCEVQITSLEFIG